MRTITETLQPDVSYRVRQRLGPLVTRFARRFGQPEYRLRDTEYVGTVQRPLDEFTETLQEHGFEWDPLAWYHQPPVGSEPTAAGRINGVYWPTDRSTPFSSLTRRTTSTCSLTRSTTGCDTRSNTSGKSISSGKPGATRCGAGSRARVYRSISDRVVAAGPHTRYATVTSISCPSFDNVDSIRTFEGNRWATSHAAARDESDAALHPVIGRLLRMTLTPFLRMTQTPFQ